MEHPEKQFRKRNMILTCLRQSTAHPSAEELFAQLEQLNANISLATVYRNLSLFRDQGLIVSLGTVGGIERFDGRLDPHVHFACSRCGCVQDVPEMNLPERTAEQVNQQLGCRVDSVKLMLTGVCSHCLTNPKDLISN